MRNAVADARHVLELYWADSRGDLVFPVDPVKIATRMDADVYEAKLASGVSGTITKRAGSRAEILLSAENGPKRQRFTCAHELGHLYANLQENGDDFEFTDYRDGRSARGEYAEEIYANRFAAALLMPADDVRRLSQGGMPLSHLARRFGVSESAMAYRLENLQLRSAIS